MVELRIEREKRIAKWYFIQGICIEKRGKIWIADVLLKEVRLRDNTKSELDDLEASGKAFISGVNTKEAQADMEKLTAAEKKLSDMQKQLHTSYQSIADTYNSCHCVSCCSYCINNHSLGSA